MRSNSIRIILLFVSVVVGSFAINFFVQNNVLAQQFDAFFYTHINGLPHTSFVDTLIFPFDLWFIPIKGFFMPAYFYVFLIPFILYMFLKRRREFYQVMTALILGTVLASIVLALQMHFSFRERPFVTLENHHISEGTKHILMKWTSFPSGHVRDTAIYATIICYFVPELQMIAILFSLFIAFLRVYTGGHYPTDVLGGLLIGFFLGKISLLLTQQLHVLCALLIKSRHEKRK